MKRSRACHDDGIHDYLNAVSKYPILTREEEVALFRRRDRGDEAASEEIICRNLRFVVKVALQFRGLGLSVEDLIQEGNVGLLQGAARFDWRRGFRFSTYAAFYIRQEILAAIQRQASLIRLPVRKARLLGKVNEVCRRFGEREGRDPTAEEVARALDTEVRGIQAILCLRHSFVSLDAPRGEEGMTVGDSLPSPIAAPTARIDEKQSRTAVHAALDVLCPRERAVVDLRFGLTPGENRRSLRQVGKVVGLSQEGVRRVEHRALDKLRRPAIREQLQPLLSA